jgi:hypothetical protein
LQQQEQKEGGEPAVHTQQQLSATTDAHTATSTAAPASNLQASDETPQPYSLAGSHVGRSLTGDADDTTPDAAEHMQPSSPPAAASIEVAEKVLVPAATPCGQHASPADSAAGTQAVLGQTVGCALTPGTAAAEAAAGALMALVGAGNSPGGVQTGIAPAGAAAKRPQPPQRAGARRRKAAAALPAAVEEAGSRKRPVRRAAAAAAVAIRLSSNLSNDPLLELQQNLQDSIVQPSSDSTPTSEMLQQVQQEGVQPAGNEKSAAAVVTLSGEQVTGSDHCQAGMLLHATALRSWQLLCMCVQLCL